MAKMASVSRKAERGERGPGRVAKVEILQRSPTSFGGREKYSTARDLRIKIVRGKALHLKRCTVHRTNNGMEDGKHAKRQALAAARCETAQRRRRARGLRCGDKESAGCAAQQDAAWRGALALAAARAPAHRATGHPGVLAEPEAQVAGLAIRVLAVRSGPAG